MHAAVAARARANARERQDALVVREIARQELLERARGQLQRRQPIVERQRLEERAVGQLARRQIGAQPAAVGQPDVGVGGARGSRRRRGCRAATRRDTRAGTPPAASRRPCATSSARPRPGRRATAAATAPSGATSAAPARARARRSVPSAARARRPRARAWRTRARCRRPAAPGCRRRPRSRPGACGRRRWRRRGRRRCARRARAPGGSCRRRPRSPRCRRGARSVVSSPARGQLPPACTTAMTTVAPALRAARAASPTAGASGSTLSPTRLRELVVRGVSSAVPPTMPTLTPSTVTMVEGTRERLAALGVDDVRREQRKLRLGACARRARRADPRPASPASCAARPARSRTRGCRRRRRRSRAR